MQAELQLFDPRQVDNTPKVISSIGTQIEPAEYKPPLTAYNPQKSVEQSLNALFPTHEEETKLQKARRILEEVATDVTDQELEIFLTEAQFLIDTFLDEFEIKIFDGLTLKQILRGE